MFFQGLGFSESRFFWVQVLEVAESMCFLNEYEVEKCPAFPGWKLISLSNRRMISVLAGRVEISSRQNGIM